MKKIESKIEKQKSPENIFEKYKKCLNLKKTKEKNEI